MSKLKYLSVFILTTTAYIAFTNHGVLTYTPLLFSFVFIPLLELFFKPNSNNLTDHKKERLKKDSYFNFILYAIVPIQIGFVIFFLIAIQEDLTTFETIGRISSLGVLCGILGINVGHELGHRSNRFEQFLGEILLLTSLETHFIPYHNRGHHYNVATPKDPATARKGELVFTFWFRSQIGSYIQAWKIEINKLKKYGKPFLSFENNMLLYTLLQILVLASIHQLINLETMFAFIAAATIGILLLETVNYIEHYGLLRKVKENGKFERVQPHHSWNSDHVVGRTILFELSRHSDHQEHVNITNSSILHQTVRK